FRQGVVGFPLAAIVMSGISALLLAMWMLGPGGRTYLKWARCALIGVCLLGSALCLTRWAADAELWHDSLSFRFWAAPFTIPFMALAALEAAMGQARPFPAEGGPWPERQKILPVIGGVFLLVLTLQSATWRS